jgi:C4-dicarboxylate-specific signal transduction histidine kinase
MWKYYIIILFAFPLNQMTYALSETNQVLQSSGLVDQNLTESDMFPANILFIDLDANIITEYKWYILGALIFIISHSIMIMYLIKLNKRQKKVIEQGRENEMLFRELAREDRLSRMSELTASFSHELNQPLTAILFNAQAGKRFLESGILDDTHAREIFENIIAEDKRAGSLISSIRSLMKLEDREKERINLNALIVETEKLFHSESSAQHIQITFKLQNRVVFVYGDKIQLQQVLLNLLFNASNSMENNGSKNKKIEISLLPTKGHAIISVKDTGPGIDNAIYHQLFKPFITTKIKGLGIGLAVSRTIIEAHNGKIWANNIPGGGADFSFRLELYHGQ